MMHSNIPSNQWNQVKGELQKTWNRLDPQALESTHGDVQAISHLVQEQYGLNADQAEQKIDECIERCGTAAGPASFSSSSSSAPSLKSSSSQSASSNSFNAPEEGMDSRRAENFNVNEPKRYGSEGQVNESRSQTRQAGGSDRSETIERQAGNSSRSEVPEKSAGASQGSTRNSGSFDSSSSKNTRDTEDSSQEE